MTSAKSHTGSTLDSTKTVYWSSEDEGGVGPLIWDFIPSVAADLYLTGGYGNDGDTPIRVSANEVYTIYDPKQELSLIEANKASGESDGTVILRPGSTS